MSQHWPGVSRTSPAGTSVVVTKRSNHRAVVGVVNLDNGEVALRKSWYVAAPSYTRVVVEEICGTSVSVDFTIKEKC